MKHFLAISVLALLALCGCNQKSDAELKARVDKLEAQQKLTAQSLDELLALSKSYQKQNQEMLNDLQGAVLAQGTNMNNVGTMFIKHLNNSALHSSPKPVEPQRTKAAQMRDGVPLDVYNTFAMQAIKDWPRDYQKQQNYIRAQIENYKHLHP